MKEIISDIKRNWKETPNSVKFWNGMILIGLVVSGMINFHLLLFELFVMSLFAWVLWMGSIGEEWIVNKHLWVWFTPVVWFMLILGLIVYGCVILSDNTIAKFNNWLDKEK